MFQEIVQVVGKKEKLKDKFSDKGDFQFNSIQVNSILFAIKVLRFEVLIENVIAK